MVKRKRQWFIECDTVSNEHLAELLLHHGFGKPEECIRFDRQGRRYDVWWVPSEFIKRLRKAKQLDDRKAYHQFKFFNADTYDGTIFPADFVERKRKSRKIQKIERELSGLTQRKKSSS